MKFLTNDFEAIKTMLYPAVDKIQQIFLIRQCYCIYLMVGEVDLGVVLAEELEDGLLPVLVAELSPQSVRQVLADLQGYRSKIDV